MTLRLTWTDRGRSRAPRDDDEQDLRAGFLWADGGTIRLRAGRVERVADPLELWPELDVLDWQWPR
jgi:hypothetical protein